MNSSTDTLDCPYCRFGTGEVAASVADSPSSGRTGVLAVGHCFLGDIILSAPIAATRLAHVFRGNMGHGRPVRPRRWRHVSWTRQRGGAPTCTRSTTAGHSPSTSLSSSSRLATTRNQQWPCPFHVSRYHGSVSFGLPRHPICPHGTPLPRTLVEGGDGLLLAFARDPQSRQAGGLVSKEARELGAGSSRVTSGWQAMVGEDGRQPWSLCAVRGTRILPIHGYDTARAGDWQSLPIQ